MGLYSIIWRLWLSLYPPQQKLKSRNTNETASTECHSSKVVVVPLGVSNVPEVSGIGATGGLALAPVAAAFGARIQDPLASWSTAAAAQPQTAANTGHPRAARSSTIPNSTHSTGYSGSGLDEEVLVRAPSRLVLSSPPPSPPYHPPSSPPFPPSSLFPSLAPLLHNLAAARPRVSTAYGPTTICGLLLLFVAWVRMMLCVR